MAEFTLTACAVELGLSVPGHPQASEPHRDKQRAPALDMSQDDCDALVTFVAAIAPPREQIFPADAEIVSTGRQLFERVGCADCHLPDLGGVRGIYSDLLLHNMGHQLAGELTVGYGAFVREPTPAEPQRKIAWCGSCWPRAQRQDRSPAFECRTPPLWGVASSTPICTMVAHRPCAKQS